MKFEDKLSRIRDLAAPNIYDDTAMSFMHAYVGCLSMEELYDAVVATLTDPFPIHNAVRKRLARLCEAHERTIDDLVERLLDQEKHSQLRSRIEACFSQLYSSFSPSQRLALLDRWQDKGTSSARGRWIKAIATDEMHYSDELIAKCWGATRDPRAAQLLVKRASAEILEGLVPDFINAGVDGWIIGKAIMKAEAVSEEVWDSLREKQPATFAYLCAKGLRKMSEEEAVQAALDCPDTSYGSGKGLAIWSIGQLGLEGALDKLRVKLRVAEQKRG